MRTVFLGSPPFATPILDRLIDSEHRPVLVVTPPARRQGRGRHLGVSPIAVLAESAGIPLLQPSSVKDEAFLESPRRQADGRRIPTRREIRGAPERTLGIGLAGLNPEALAEKLPGVRVTAVAR